MPIWASSRSPSLGAALAWAAAGACAPLPVQADERNEARTILFGSLDAGRSAFVQTGLKHGPAGLTASGFTLLAGLGYGARTERDRSQPDASSRPPRVMRHTAAGYAVAGWQWVHDWGMTALFAGPEAGTEIVGGAGPGRPLRVGLRVHGEIWAHPVAGTLATATLIAGSARADVWGRVSWGWQAFGAYLGPEASLYADRTGYRKWSLGLHATDAGLAGLRARLSAGWLLEEQIRRPGLYVALTLWRPL
ncbi:cellulose biosynthesis protein BcsS [Methylobacterium oryzisoli]|uniref:cellulose biosynthesis protein BcsS n=1 Tax=Methylobacterium oryzisoli TaxID=3385502 RepID=UPI00389271AA